MLNLLGNAVKYTDTGSVELRLKAGQSAGSLCVEIADSGCGIPETRRSDLFQEFERLEASASVEGTGLGLSIAARIVRLMGGAINHAPNPAGAGSIFWFEVPAGSCPPAVAQEPIRAATSVFGKRILLVDDIAMNRDIISAFLKVAGHLAILADCGPEAIRLADEQPFDLILMDVRMPDMDGLEATRRIRGTPGPNRTTPVLAMTAYTFPEHVAECLQAGMNGHVPKPVDYETLTRAIERAVIACATTPASGSEDPTVRQTAFHAAVDKDFRHRTDNCRTEDACRQLEAVPVRL